MIRNIFSYANVFLHTARKMLRFTTGNKTQKAYIKIFCFFNKEKTGYEHCIQYFYIGGQIILNAAKVLVPRKSADVLQKVVS